MGARSSKAAARLGAGLLLALTALIAAGPAGAGDADRPSVLLVTIDTLRADRLGCYGYAAATTPHLDRLAASGVIFDEARTHVPLTLPAHATLLTGALPPRHGVRANGLFSLPADGPTLAGAMRDAGYATAAFVSSVVLDRAYGLDRGFDLYDDNQRQGPRAAFDYRERAASQLVDAVARELPGLPAPFFLWVHLYDPHRPWVAPAPFARAHPGRAYDAEIAFADAAFGQIHSLAAERAGGKLIVAVTSDHGESLGQHGENQHGYTLHRGVLRVPLILAGPGLPRRSVTQPAGLVDLAPTLAALAGVPFDAVDGRSLERLWSAEAASTIEPLWEETLHPLYDSGWAPMRGMLTRTWHVVDSPLPELYDRRHDPDDERNLARSQPRILRQLLERMRTRAGELGDRGALAPAVDDTPAQRERLERLASLGYLSAGAPTALREDRLDAKQGLNGFRALEQADELLDRGRPGAAAELLEPHVRSDPGNPRLWHQWGRALMRSGDHGRAERALRRAQELAPDREFIAYSLAALLRARGDDREARRELEAILERNPRAVDAALELAAMAVAAGDASRARRLLRGVYAAGARDPDLLDRLARDRLAAGDRDAARRLFVESLELWPGNPTARLELGRVALRDGDAGTAIDLLAGCSDGRRALECRVELARAYVVGPRDLHAARELLLAARELAEDQGQRVAEVDRRLDALAGMQR